MAATNLLSIASRIRWCEKMKNRGHSTLSDTLLLISGRYTAALTSESMLLTRSSGYTVLCCSRGQHEGPLYRERNSLHTVESFSDSIGVACNRLPIQLRPAALCAPWHPTIEQITGPLQGTSSFAASYHTLPAWLPGLCPVV